MSVVALCLSALSLAGCKLNYAGEEFKLTINPDGSGDLTVLYQNMGSNADSRQEKNDDFDLLKKAARDDTIVKEAASKGVTIIKRRLDFIGYTLNGYLEASAKDWHDLFDVLTHYRVEEKNGKIYLLPQNGKLIRASDEKRVVKRHGRLGFSWPADTTEIAFTAGYTVDGSSFRLDFHNRYDGD